MRSNELRLGNIIGDHYLNEVVVDIDILKTIDDHTSPIGQDGVYYPLLLTEEQLLKFGFEKFEGAYYFPYKAMFLCVQFGELFSVGICRKEDVVFYNKYDHIKYVHQLQNLFFAINGTELTIKS